MSRVEQVISEIEGYIKEYRPSVFSTSKIIVQKEELEEKLSELCMAIPGELNQSKKILSNQNAIMLDVQTRHDTMVNEASKKTEQLINQSETVQKVTVIANEILQSTRAQAQNIVGAAQTEANDIRFSSIQYTDELPLSAQNIIGGASREADARSRALQLAFRQSFDQITANCQQLVTNNEATQATGQQQ